MSLKTNSGERALREPIAIVGIGCRFPGGANNPQRFWKLLADGVDAISPIPASRFDADVYYDTSPGTPGKIASREGGYLDDIAEFDPYFFGISPREAVYMDPQQRLLLEVTWEAFEDGGQLPADFAGSNTGVFVGMWTGDYEVGAFRETSDINLYVTTGGGRYAAAGRLSYIFDFRGPSMTLDTACSSSLVAVHLACRSLWQGEAEAAVAAAANLILEPSITIGYSRSKMLSPDGRCKFGDATANGYVRSEGVAALILKPLSAALANNDPIYALIRGTAVNNDGRSSGTLVAPGEETQSVVFEEAYRVAGVSPQQLGYIEAHGTGTTVGDAVELTALGSILKQYGVERCAVGSVKTNIGHTEAASGMAGLIKAALSLKHRQIPPSLHMRTPTPKVQWNELPIEIPQEMQPWPADNKPALAGVNSFGVTGTNAHAVLQEMVWPVEEATAAGIANRAPEGARLFPLSAHTEEALQQRARDLAHYLEMDKGQGIDFGDLAYTLAMRRTHQASRVALLAETQDELLAQLKAMDTGAVATVVSRGVEGAAGKGSGVVFVFSGQGQQWSGMGRELLETEPVFRDKIREIDGLLERYVSWSLVDELTNEDNRLADTHIAQPAIFAIQVGLAALWRSWGVTPAAVVGHSVGEVAAAHIAGVLNLEDAVRVIYHRGRLMQQATGLGKMAAVGLTRADVERRLDGVEGVGIGAENSPMSLTLSGDAQALEDLVQTLQSEGTFARMLNVNYAFHSPVMTPFQDSLREALGGLEVSAPSLPIYSTVRGGRAQAGDYDAAYWGRNIRRPVLFSQAIAAMVADGYTGVVEISAHPVLMHSILQCAPDWPVAPSMRREACARDVLLQSLGLLFEIGEEIDWEGVLEADGRRVVTLPTYPWQRQHFWRPTNRSHRASVGKPAGNVLLGNRLSTPSPTFEALLDGSQLSNSYLHHVGSTPLLSAAACLDGLLALGANVGRAERVRLDEVRLEKPLVLSEPLTVQWVCVGDKAQLFSLQDDDSWQLHATARMREDEMAADGADAADAAVLQSELEAVAKQFGGTVVDLAESKRVQYFAEVWQTEDQALGRLQPNLSRTEAIRSAMELLLLLAKESNDAAYEYVMAVAERVQGQGEGQEPAWCQVTLISEDVERVAGEVTLLDEGGAHIFEASGLQLARVSGAELLPVAVDDWFYEVAWEAMPLAALSRREELPQSKAATLEGERERPWLLIADKQGVGDRLAALLQSQAQAVTVVEEGAAVEEPGEKSWRGVINLMGLDATADTAMGVCEAAVGLIQKTDAPMWLVTERSVAVQAREMAQPVDGSSDELPFAAPLWGLGRTLALERPAQWGGLIDLDGGNRDDQAKYIFDELMVDDVEDQVAYRDGQRFVARLRATAAPAEAPSDVFGDGCYLITGGLGNLGLHVARWLAGQGASNLVLTSRSGLPPRAEWASLEENSVVARRAGAVQELEALGVTVTVARCNSVDRAGMEALFAQFGETLPQLRGVVHAAGVMRMESLAEMSAEALGEVLAPKLVGGRLLHELTQALELDFFVLFSSSAGILGGVELGHYAAANSLLDALAQFRQSQGLPGLSVDWGWWGGDTMVTADLANRFERIGQNAMPPNGALQALGRLLLQRAGQVMVALIDWGRFRPVYEAKRARPLLFEIDYEEAKPVNEGSMLAKLAQAPPEKQVEQLRGYVRTVVAEVMGYSEVLALDTHAGFFNIGMDSMMAVQLRTRLELDLGQALPTTVAFEYPTVERLTEYLYVEALGLQEREAAPDVEAVAEDGEAEEARLSGDDLLSMFDDELAALDELIDI